MSTNWNTRSVKRCCRLPHGNGRNATEARWFGRKRAFSIALLSIPRVRRAPRYCMTLIPCDLKLARRPIEEQYLEVAHLPQRILARVVACTALAAPLLPAESPLVITHVNIVDVVDGRIKRDMTLLVVDGKIGEIRHGRGRKIPSRATLVDGSG